MIGGNSINKRPAQPFPENQLQFPADMSNQMQLCGNLPSELHANPVNYLGNSQMTPILLPNKNAEAVARQHRLQFSLANQVLNDNSEQQFSIYNQNHPVSTGLRLSYDDDERNSSITSGSGSMTTPSVFSCLGVDVRRELNRQNELDQFLKIQEENMRKGIRTLKQQHMASLLKALEKDAAKKLHEKDLALANVTRKNQELAEHMKQVAAHAQTWCHWAKYNESVIDTLKNNLQQAMQDFNNQEKEGTGESEAASCIDPNNYLGGYGNSSDVKKDMICRSCRAKEVSILLMPCRHLCLCKDCEGLVNACPVCQMVTSGRFEVYLS